MFMQDRAGIVGRRNECRESNSDRSDRGLSLDCLCTSVVYTVEITRECV